MIRFHKPSIQLDRDDYLDITNIFESGWVSSGKYVRALEETLKDRYRVKHVIACSNATSGLIIALRSAEWIHQNIYIPTFTWPSTAYAIKCAHSDVSYCDINKDTWLLDTENYKNKTVLAVDTFGNNVKVHDKNNTIIDAAHGFDIKDLGNRALVEVMSLSHTKTITGCEGGIIFTNKDSIANKAKELVRLSSRMEEINALVALNSLAYYDSVRRLSINDIREAYDKKLTGNLIHRQKLNDGANPSVYAIKFTEKHIRDRVARELTNNGIEYKIYYEPLVSDYDNADDLFSKIICLPLYEEMHHEVDNITTIIMQNNYNEYNYEYLQ